MARPCVHRRQLLRGGTGLLMASPVAVPEVPGVSWGLEQTAGRRALWQWGANPGFRALAMAELESGNAVVALVARENGMDPAKALLRQALPGPHPELALGPVR